jgi:hypothetical protein
VCCKRPGRKNSWFLPVFCDHIGDHIADLLGGSGPEARGGPDEHLGVAADGANDVGVAAPFPPPPRGTARFAAFAA